MTQTGRKATLALVAAIAMMMAERASAQDEPTAAPGRQEATIVLHVINYAALTNAVLNVAKARVAMVYDLIGVRIVWVDDKHTVVRHHGGRLHLTVLLLSRDMAERTISAGDIKDGVLARAHVTSGRASIFCDRIATAPGVPNFPIPLGDVITHEVGHLVLGANSHSRSGIMRADMDVKALHLRSFDKRQAAAIRTSLMELTAGNTER
jgi:hypothetical protein